MNDADAKLIKMLRQRAKRIGEKEARRALTGEKSQALLDSAKLLAGAADRLEMLGGALAGGIRRDLKSDSGLVAQIAAQIRHSDPDFVPEEELAVAIIDMIESRLAGPVDAASAAVADAQGN